MELKNIKILINQKNFIDAKNGLLELINNKAQFINNLVNLEDNYKNLYYTIFCFIC